MRYLLLMIAAGLLASCTSREIRRGINYWEYADWPRDAAEFNEALYAYTKDWFPDYDLPVFELKLYRDPEDVPGVQFADRVRSGGAIAELVSGRLHIPVWTAHKFAFGDHSRSPWRLLRHEIAHLHLHEATAITLPVDLAVRIGTDHLPTAPWWLQEGWATMIENAAMSDGSVRAMKVNYERQRHLYHLMRHQQLPDPFMVIRRPFMLLGNAADYAVAYALFRDVARDDGKGAPGGGRASVRRYMEMAQRGFFAEDADLHHELRALLLDNDQRLREDWIKQWQSHISSAGSRAFKEAWVGESSDDEWISNWKKRQ